MKELIFIITFFPSGRRAKKIFTHEILRKPFPHYSLALAKNLYPKRIFLFLDKKNEPLKEILKEEFSTFVIERWEQIFTEILKDNKSFEEKNFLILRAEYPLISLPTLKALIRKHLKDKNVLTFLTNNKEIPALVLDGKVLSYLDKAQFKGRNFEKFLKNLILFFYEKGERVGEFLSKKEDEFLSLEGRGNFPRIIEALRVRKIEEVQRKGVKVLDPRTTWIDWDVKIGKGTTIYPFTIIEGETSIGKKCFIYPFSHIKDCEISDSVNILTSSYLEGAKVMKGASVGPYSRIRPGTVIESKARIGNFVEVKNTVVGKRSKALHLTYLGDAKIGSDVNVGAGTITCNFDGKNKNTTIIESGAFIGSGTELVAPVKVGKKAYIGAGSTITKDVPPYALGIARERQTNIENWVKRRKK
jgi:bifunctional UDP-N-acetylglucosamine pyrophosphorylase/glucosamine-1-phosphate N-acetyltransferase